MLGIEDDVWLPWAALLLILPLKWILAAVTAACVHEAAHLICIYLFGGRVRRIRLKACGAVIEAERISGYREVLCALAGPLGSLSLLLWIRSVPLLGLCGLVQGLFNLFPVYPMDGGRILTGLLESLIPSKAEMISKIVQNSILFAILITAIVCSVWFHLGVLPVLFAAGTILSALLRKKT